MSDQTEHQAEEVKKAAEKDREPTTAERTTEKVNERSWPEALQIPKALPEAGLGA